MNQEKYREETYVIPENLEGERADITLSLMLPQFSRTGIQRLIEEKKVFVEGQDSITKKLKLKAGDKVTIIIDEPKELAVEKENIPLDIIFEDDSVLVINKPRGMVVHPAPGNQSGTMVNAIMYHCGESLSAINGTIRPGIVHRIDKDTSGLLMVAKSDEAHKNLAYQLEKHTITRGYVALVYNNIKDDEGIIAEPIGSDAKVWHKKVVRYDKSKRAVTKYKVLKRMGKYNLVEARLETGRTHQIRVHMAHINHPLVGDTLYGPKKGAFAIEGQMLHAYLLGFIHPVTKEYMEFKVMPPKAFADVVNQAIKQENQTTAKDWKNSLMEIVE